MFETGDVVLHKYGQKMTVSSYEELMKVVQCVWFSPTGKLKRGHFQPSDLTKVE